MRVQHEDLQVNLEISLEFEAFLCLCQHQRSVRSTMALWRQLNCFKESLSGGLGGLITITLEPTVHLLGRVVCTKKSCKIYTEN